MPTPSDIVLRNLTNPPTKGLQSPFIATVPEFRDGSRPADPVSEPDPSVNWVAHSQSSRAPAPVLRFTDLTSGPATGLWDSLGEGAIVTLWGQGLGDSQGTSKVYFTDSLGAKREAAHVYYWKRADGTLPSGPARLWYSHLMQEIAFSIPAASASGEGLITVEVNGVESVTVNDSLNIVSGLPFTVRTGDILFLDESGTGVGTFSDPLPLTNASINTASAGSLVYLMSGQIGHDNAPTAIYINGEQTTSTASAPFTVAAYPGYQPTLMGQRGFEGYRSGSTVASKLDVYSSDFTEVSDTDQPTGSRIDTKGTWGIKTTDYGRVIGTRITDISGMCANRFQGAIVGSYSGGVADAKIFGNEIHDYGCAGTNKLHHTTYITNRNTADEDVEAWEFGWNFLHGNPAKFGIHNYGQAENSSPSGSPIGDLKTHDNVICEQGGSGISNGSSGGWTNDSYIYNNVLIDVGRAAAWNGIDPQTTDGANAGGISCYDTYFGTSGVTHCYDNLIYKHTVDMNQTNPGLLTFRGRDAGGEGTYVWSRNVGYSTADHLYIGYTYNADSKLSLVTGSNNSWFTDADTTDRAVVPNWDSNPITTAPQISLDGAIVTVSGGSPLIGDGSDWTRFDIYGVPRPATGATIGPVESIA